MEILKIKVKDLEDMNKLGKLGYETEQDIETDDEDNENWKTIPTNKRTKKRPTHIKKK